MLEFEELVGKLHNFYNLFYTLYYRNGRGMTEDKDGMVG